MKGDPRIILGIDPGTLNAGWAIMDDEGHLLDYGAVRCPPKDPVHIRVYKVYLALLDITKAHNVNEIAVEDQFMHNNAKTLKVLSNVKATAMLIAAQYDIPYIEYAPMSIKKCFTGSGKASKEEMVATAIAKYQVDEGIQNDIADAIGIAYTQLMEGAR